MKVLVTGHDGYIGTVLVPMLEGRGHEVHGLDSYLFHDCLFGPEVPDPQSLHLDVRDVQPAHLEGFDAILHLAGLSNDPLGDLNPDCTYEINWRASVRLAEAAKAAGVRRFVFSSSCSNYGAGGEDMLDEGSAFNPVTPYGESKVLVERDVSKMADGAFCPTFLRNATAFGMSPRLRGDLVLTNLVGFAMTTGKVLMKSDGTPWRPLVHIEDISRAFVAVLEAPEDKVHNEAFNVGRTDQNFRINEIAEMVAEVVPDCHIEYAEGAGPDKRCYRVDCDKIRRVLPAFEPAWTIRDGVEEAYREFSEKGIDFDTFTSSRYLRIKHVKELLDAGRIDKDLRWTGAPSRA
ncbi:MAG: NAD(P)-dependent oxidoreductase [Planctomycetota bacterium]